MAKLLSSWELTPLFVSGAYFAGGEVEVGFRLMQVGKVYAHLSIFRVCWAQMTPKSISDWLKWIGVYASVTLAVTVLGNHGKFEVLSFCAGFVPLVIPFVRCLDQTGSKYKHTINYCRTVVNAGKIDDLISEETMIRIVQSGTVQNLAQFREARARFISAQKPDKEQVLVSDLDKTK